VDKVFQETVKAVEEVLVVSVVLLLQLAVVVLWNLLYPLLLRLTQ
jgi:hypothetical protein